MIPLEKADWEQAKNEATAQIKQGTILMIQGELLLGKAIQELEAFPEEKKEESITGTA